jgi:GT2 family glycosyltransferase
MNLTAPNHNRQDTVPNAGSSGAMPVTRAGGPARPAFLPNDLILEPLSRKPVILPEATVAAVRGLSAGGSATDARSMGTDTETPLAERIDSPAQTRFPRVSIVVVTRDNLVFSKLCLESVLVNTDYPDYELIVVDNGSGEELLSYLDLLADRVPFVRIVRNETNRGFATANNMGLAQAAGDRFVLLNNDTIVPRGWLTGLIRHLDEPRVGAVGPLTNRSVNETQIETSYRTYGEFEEFAREQTQRHAEERFEIPMLAMFCFAIKRETYERVGPLDEHYDIGTFEDDDYAVRLRREGYRLICAEDVFVHHFGGASLGSLLASRDYQDLLNANRVRFERKWGIVWQPHRHRESPAYRRVIARIKEVARKVIPAGARVLVISRGDPELLGLEGMVAEHFPQNSDRSYTGYHPAGSADAIAHLDALRQGGSEFLLVPASALWWLEHYAGFREHLAKVQEETIREPDVCVIFRLSRPARDDVLTRDY